MRLIDPNQCTEIERIPRTCLLCVAIVDNCYVYVYVNEMRVTDVL